MQRVGLLNSEQSGSCSSTSEHWPQWHPCISLYDCWRMVPVFLPPDPVSACTAFLHCYLPDDVVNLTQLLPFVPAVLKVYCAEGQASKPVAVPPSCA